MQWLKRLYKPRLTKEFRTCTAPASDFSKSLLQLSTSGNSIDFGRMPPEMHVEPGLLGRPETATLTASSSNLVTAPVCSFVLCYTAALATKPAPGRCRVSLSKTVQRRRGGSITGARAEGPCNTGLAVWALNQDGALYSTVLSQHSAQLLQVWLQICKLQHTAGVCFSKLSRPMCQGYHETRLGFKMHLSACGPGVTTVCTGWLRQFGLCDYKQNEHA